MTFTGVRIVLVAPGPLAPCGAGEEANRLAALLLGDGASVERMTPLAIDRAGAHALTWTVRLWRASARADAIHLIADTAWPWQRHVDTALQIARLRGSRLVISHRGGDIAALLEQDIACLHHADVLLVPSAALARMFGLRGLNPRVLPAPSEWNWPRLRQPYRHLVRGGRSGVYTRLVSSLLFPLHERFKRHPTHRLRLGMEQSQWWSQAQLHGMRLERLRALLLHAQSQVPHYRDLFARIGFDAAKVDSLECLHRLPILDKDTMRAGAQRFQSAQADRLKQFSTGGSNGEPLRFQLGTERIAHDVAAKWRATRWWHVDIGDRELVIWGSAIELKAQDRLRTLRDGVFRTRLLPAFDLSAARLDRFLARLRKFRPAMMIGYPSAMSLMARHATARRIALDDLGIRVAFATAERLYDDQRAQIEQVFGCPVANGYGGRDSGFIAHECPSGGMHITAEDVIVEIVDPAGRALPIGQSGQIVVTHLATRDFPFIRYATGDIGALSHRACPCGRTLPLLEQIEGRSTDFVHASDGRVMHGLALIYILRELPQIRAFKIVQESVDQTRVLVVATPSLPATVKATIETGFKARLGAQVRVLIDEVGSIAPEASGKFRYVVSHVTAP
ncbi:MAG: AMP-binding protein [Pseudomonadota bacterium]